MFLNVKSKSLVSTSNTEAVDFHPTQPWLLTGNLSGIAKFYNLESGKAIHIFSLSAATIYCVKFIARKNWYVIGSEHGWLHVFNCTTHEEVITFQAHANSITCLAVHPASPIILTGSHDETIKAWNWDKQWHNIQTYQAGSWISSIAFNPRDLNTFASANSDCIVKMWSIPSPIPDFTIQAHEEPVNCVDFHPSVDKPYLVTASSDNTVKIWDYLSQRCVHTMAGHTNVVTFAVYHPSLPIIISGSWDYSIKIWNSETYRLEHSLNYKLGWISCIAFHKCTSEIAVGFDKAVVTLELAHSGPFPMVVSSGDTSVDVEASKEQVYKFLEGRELTMSTTTGPERELECAELLDSLTNAYDTHISPCAPAPSQLRRVQANSYRQCVTLAMELMATKATSKLISELRDDKAQYVADFLSEMVIDKEIFTRHDRKRTLHLLSKLAKSAEVFPQSLELEGVQADLTCFVAAGGYGFIYKGEHEGSPVCIKAVQIGLEGIDRKKMRAHASELTIWANLKHLNVLPFLGIYSSKEEVPRICIVSPWMVNGDLLQYLRKVPDVPRKPLVHDILSGLQYLHDLDIIHADLKAKNVLISEAGKAMLADFGISRLSITLTTILTNAGTGTAYWMAPELHLDDEPSPSRETDIWAFACTCHEIIAGTMPFNQYRNPVMLIGAFMRGKIIPSKPTPGIGWDEDVWSVAMRCWQRDPESRPRAHELLDMINSFNYPDDRPSDPESPRKRNDAMIDYDRILSILNEIRQSAAA